MLRRGKGKGRGVKYEIDVETIVANVEKALDMDDMPARHIVEKAVDAWIESIIDALESDSEWYATDYNSPFLRDFEGWMRHYKRLG